MSLTDAPDPAARDGGCHPLRNEMLKGRASAGQGEKTLTPDEFRPANRRLVRLWRKPRTLNPSLQLPDYYIVEGLNSLGTQMVGTGIYFWRANTAVCTRPFWAQGSFLDRSLVQREGRCWEAPGARSSACWVLRSP